MHPRCTALLGLGYGYVSIANGGFLFGTYTYSQPDDFIRDELRLALERALQRRKRKGSSSSANGSSSSSANSSNNAFDVSVFVEHDYKDVDVLSASMMRDGKLLETVNVTVKSYEIKDKRLTVFVKLHSGL